MEKNLQHSVRNGSQPSGSDMVRRLVLAFLQRSVSWRTEQNLTVNEDLVLQHLTSEPRASADLCRRIGIKSASMTHIIAGLEQRNLVRRVPHPTDGRQVLLYVTKAALKVRADAQMLLDLDALFAQLPASDQRRIEKFLEAASQQLRNNGTRDI